MAYPAAYDSYNTQLAYPNRQSVYGDYNYAEPGYDVSRLSFEWLIQTHVCPSQAYAQPYPIYAQRTASQYAGVQCMFYPFRPSNLTIDDEHCFYQHSILISTSEMPTTH